jgi:fused signal recognition particle receptor
MSFFKRLKNKFSGADQQEEQEQNQLDTSLTDDSEVESTEEKPKKLKN